MTFLTEEEGAAEFVRLECEAVTGEVTGTNLMRDVYWAWCARRAMRSQAAMKDALAMAGFTRTRRGWEGVRLRRYVKPEPDPLA